MSVYTLALFVHLVGAIAIFAGLGIWLFAAVALRRAERVEQVRFIAGPTIVAGNVLVGGVVVLAAAGIYMAFTTWADTRPAWIVVATVGFLLLAPFGAVILDPRLRAISSLAMTTPDGPLPEPLAARVRDPILLAGLQVYLAVLLGIVFMMTIKPTTVGGAVLVFAIALALGLASALPLFRRGVRSRAPSPAAGARS